MTMSFIPLGALIDGKYTRFIDVTPQDKAALPAYEEARKVEDEYQDRLGEKNYLLIHGFREQRHASRQEIEKAVSAVKESAKEGNVLAMRQYAAWQEQGLQAVEIGDKPLQKPQTLLKKDTEAAEILHQKAAQISNHPFGKLGEEIDALSQNTGHQAQEASSDPKITGHPFQEYAPIQFLLAERLHNSGNIEQATELYSKSAEQGFGQAHCMLGSLNEENNPLEAVRHYLQAAKNGNVAEAQYCLGVVYKLDFFDIKKAEASFLQGARQGDSMARSALGEIYEDQKNDPKAVLFFCAAAAGRDKDADDVLSEHNSGIGNWKQEAATLWLDAASLDKPLSFNAQGNAVTHNWNNFLTGYWTHEYLKGHKEMAPEIHLTVAMDTIRGLDGFGVREVIDYQKRGIEELGLMPALVCAGRFDKAKFDIIKEGRPALQQAREAHDEAIGKNERLPEAQKKFDEALKAVEQIAPECAKTLARSRPEANSQGLIDVLHSNLKTTTQTSYMSVMEAVMAPAPAIGPVHLLMPAAIDVLAQTRSFQKAMAAAVAGMFGASTVRTMTAPGTGEEFITTTRKGLPEELGEKIASYLPPSTINTVARVNSASAAGVRAILYDKKPQEGRVEAVKEERAGAAAAGPAMRG